MEDEHDEVESAEMHFEDDIVVVEKNKKRTVKTHAQIQALENFYTKYKYPTEMMKADLAESTGLTEKQISGWFCHRRLKDKKIYFSCLAAARQDRSSGVIQDHGSGHRQDSCGSTPQGDDRNFDTREVESGRLILPEHSAVGLTYERGGLYSGNNNHMEDASSGSSSSSRSMSNHRKENHFDMATSRYPIARFPMDGPGAKRRSGPSGYLKVKRSFENPAVTAVKRQLGNLYRDDGPPLGVEFDLLPPGAFESMQDLVDGETCCTGEAVSSVSPGISKIHQHPKFGKPNRFGCEYGSSMSPLSSKIDRATFKVPQGSDVPDNYGHQKFKRNSSPGCYSWRCPELSTRDLSGSDSRDEFGMKYRNGVEDMRVSSVSSNLSMKAFEYHRPSFKMQSRQIAKDAKIHPRISMTNANQIEIPYKNVIAASKRTWDRIPQRQPFMTKPSLATNRAGTYQSIRSGGRAEMLSSFSEEEEEGSAETSCSVE